MRGAALLALLALSAQAQPAFFATGPATSGSSSAQSTTADVVLFVDPLGNDANACTASGTAACLTIQAALNKSPKVLRHRLTVNVAAGNYAGFAISGFTFDPSFQKTTTGLLIQGVQANVTPATGTATGTASAGTAGSTTTFGTLTDSTQTWTVDDFKGKHITITGGTGSGQVKVITSNTADTITIAGTWTAPTGSTTYAIQSPASVITSTTPAVVTPLGANNVGLGAAGLQSFGNGSGTSTSTTGVFIVVSDMGITNSSGTGFFIHGPTGVQIRRSRITGGFSQVSSAGYFTLTESAIDTAPTSIGLQSNAGASVIVNQSFIRGGSGGITAGTVSRISVTNSQLEVTTTAAAGCLAVVTGAVGFATSMRCDCGSLSASYATLASASSINLSSAFHVTNCTSGIAADPDGLVMFTTNSATFSGNALTNAALAVSGGSIILPSAITITSGTADLSVDNASQTAPFSALGAIYGCLTSLNTGSKVCRL